MRLSQKAMAKSFGMKRREYGIAEAEGTLKLPGFMVVVEPLEPHEQCFLWRYRSGWTQQECADLMGITRYWYNLMENGRAPSDRLEAFWNER
jgi:DNA-binding XRE family transcriptional regulator